MTNEQISEIQARIDQLSKDMKLINRELDRVENDLKGPTLYELKLLGLIERVHKKVYREIEEHFH